MVGVKERIKKGIEMAIFSFLHPQYLFLLFGIPLIFFIHFLSLGNRKKNALKFANFDAIAKIEGIDFFSKNIVILFVNVIILVSLVLAISGLVFHTTMESSSFSYIIAIDSSQSMEAKDLDPNRIVAAKETAINFLETSPIDVKMGVISFSGSTRIEIDLTKNKDEIQRAISGIAIGNYGGTDLYEAVLTSSNLLKDESHKAVILLTDGQINVGTIDDAVDYANDHDVLVHTIGIGTEEGGETQYGFSKLDKDALKSVAYHTEGVYADAQNRENLSQAFLDILNLTKRKVSIELFNYLILFAFVLLVLKFFLTNTKYVSFP